MKKIRSKTIVSEDNSMKLSQNKFKINPKFAQLTHKNKIQNETYKEQNSLLSYRTYKEASNQINGKIQVCQKKLNKKLFLMPKLALETEKNLTLNDLNIAEKNNGSNTIKSNKHKILFFNKTDNNNDQIYKEKINTIENEHNRIYVHKKPKKYKSKKIITSRNENNIKEIAYGNTFCQTNQNKNYYYSKYIDFPDKTKYFTKRDLNEFEKMNNNDSNLDFKIRNNKFLNRSPIAENRNKLSQSGLENGNNISENESSNKSKGIKYSDISEDLEERLDNLNDYINIYSISNNNNNLTDDNENNKSLENDKIIMNNNNNKIKSKKIFINTNKINNLKKNGIDKTEEKNTININKNIIINKKIILIPEEKSACAKTSYGFFNTFTNKYKNIIHMPYTNNSNNYLNENIHFHRKFGHSRTKPSLNNFIYKKKNSFVSPSPKMSRYINYYTENNKHNHNHNSKSSKKKQKKLLIQNTIEEVQMSSTAKDFFDQKKNNFYNNVENVANQTFYNNKFKEKNNDINSKKENDNNKKEIFQTKNDLYSKISASSENINHKLIIGNTNKNILILDEKEDNEINKNSYSSLFNILNALEGKLKLILNKIIKYQNCEKDICELIHFYFDNNFYEEKILLFKNDKNKEIITNDAKMEIIYLFLCYDILCSKKFNKACILLKTIFTLLYDNYLLLLILLIKNNKEQDIKSLNNLNSIVNDFISKNNDLQNINNINENIIIEIIEKNSNNSLNFYKMLIESLYQKFYNEKDNSFKFPDCIKNKDKDKDNNSINRIKYVKCSFFNEVYTKIQNISFDELKIFFNKFLNKRNEKKSFIKLRYSKGIKIKTKQRKNEENDASFGKNYFLPPINNNYIYTLIFNLDETLIYSNKKFPKLGKKSLILRPHIHEFLTEMKNMYELIIFSDSSKEHIDPIIDKIQKNEKYFDYILCNKYITYDNEGEKIKDLSLLGRELRNIIAIDIKEKLYKFNKDNLICIKPFWGDIDNDKNTLKLLGNFLKELKIDSEKTGDIRISLNNLRNKINPKIINNLD